jgi:hypothetical protein
MNQVASTESAYNTDATNVATIQTAIQTATAPLVGAEAQQNTDAIAYNAALQNLSAVALAAQVPVAPAPAAPAGN